MQGFLTYSVSNFTIQPPLHTHTVYNSSLQVVKVFMIYQVTGLVSPFFFLNELVEQYARASDSLNIQLYCKNPPPPHTQYNSSLQVVKRCLFTCLSPLPRLIVD